MVLFVKDLSVSVRTKHHQTIPIIKDISFSMKKKEKVAIVGASGAGKTMLTRAFLSLLPNNAVFSASSTLRVNNQYIYKDGQYVAQSGAPMAVILQDPHTALNPAMRIYRQIEEVLPRSMSKESKKDAIHKMLANVYLRDPEKISRSYPHELSGGMAQRVMISMMLALKPVVLIADEPTSSLDAPVGTGIMKLIVNKVEECNTALLLISHDINMVKHFCDRIVVMFCGSIVENLPTNRLHHAQHPHTQQLLKASGWCL